MTYRVIVWGPGEVGGTALRAILKRPEFAVVGCKVYSDSKDGVDIGTLAGGEPIGVTATKCSDELIALHADCVVHTPMLPFDISDTDDEIIRLLESGKNVVSAVSYTAPEFFGADYIAKFEDACQRGGVSFHGSGLYPGFVERLAVIADECGGNAERLGARRFEDEHGRRGVPCGVAACFPRCAESARRKARRIGLALDELIAGELFDGELVLVERR